MGKIKIAIVTRKMITGGVEQALLAMLKRIDYSESEVDLYLESFGGELFAEIPNNVNVYLIPTVSKKQIWKHPLLALKKLEYKIFLKLNKCSYTEQCYWSHKMLLPMKKEYDYAISYHAPNTVPVYYTIDCINAKRKILWLHGDLDSNEGDNMLLYSYHSKYDKVCCVAESLRDSFLYFHPEMKERVAVVYNYVEKDVIIEKSKVGDSFEDCYDGIRILTIGRLSYQKGYDIAVEVCKKLIKDNYNFRWYICGEGEERSKIERLIEQNDLESHLILLGNKKNPYGYLKKCDLYVQTSRFEGYCTTTNEARIFRKPVITTEVSGAREQFEHGKSGWIVPIDPIQIAIQIEECLDNPNVLKYVSDSLKMKDINIDINLKEILQK